MRDLIKWMIAVKIAVKIAKNDFNAAAIVNGLELSSLSVACKAEGCQQGYYALGYQENEDEDGEVVWGVCSCCGGYDWEACPVCTMEAMLSEDEDG